MKVNIIKGRGVGNSVDYKKSRSTKCSGSWRRGFVETSFYEAACIGKAIEISRENEYCSFYKKQI